MFAKLLAIRDSIKSALKLNPVHKRYRAKSGPRLAVEALEQRDTPAVFHSFSGGSLHIWFNNAPVSSAGPYNEQATVLSSYNGKVTLTYAGTEKVINDARLKPIQAGAVKEIVIDGSDQPNFIDLRFVSAQSGFSPSLSGRVTIRGHGGDDVLIGSQFDDRIRGGAGNDQIYAGAGNDWIAGDAGDDWLYGGYGNTVYQGGQGRDWFDRFQAGDRVVDFNRAEDFYDPIGVAPELIAMDKALRDRLIKGRWNLGNEL